MHEEGALVPCLRGNHPSRENGTGMSQAATAVGGLGIERPGLSPRSYAQAAYGARQWPLSRRPSRNAALGLHQRSRSGFDRLSRPCMSPSAMRHSPYSARQHSHSTIRPLAFGRAPIALRSKPNQLDRFRPKGEGRIWGIGQAQFGRKRRDSKSYPAFVNSLGEVARIRSPQLPTSVTVQAGDR